MEPRIQYAKTSDGASIAFATMGDGPPLVYMPQIPLGNLKFEWEWPEYRHFFERMGRSRLLVRFDCRGSGLSDRGSIDFSLEAQVRDLEAVVDHAGIGPFTLLAFIRAGPAAITYAHRNPERVSRLILWGAFARAADYRLSPQVQALGALIGQDWNLFTQTASHYMYGHSGGEQARLYEELIRASVTHEAMQAYSSATLHDDVSALLPELSVPVLVIHYRNFSWLPLEVAQEQAAQIPDARLAIFDDAGVGSFPDGIDKEWLTVADFLGDAESAVGAQEVSTFRSVLFTDLVGHTKMMSRLGDEEGRAVLREHERITREVLKASGGTEVKTMGDGFMASFGSVTKAVECAIALQRAFAEHEGEELLVRVGLNAGEPIEEDGDLFGATVILASRIAAKADGGEILVADTVRGLCNGKGFLFADRGEFVAKGFEEPVRVYEVGWKE